MLAILSTFTNTDLVAYPNTKAVDSSGALATDGTEFIAALVNDYCFGPMQSLLDYTDQTPNGTVEGPSNSQYLEGLRRAFSYPGEVFAAAFNDDPATLGIRAIKLIGQGVAVSTYPELLAATYVGDGNNAAVAAASGAFYRADNSDGTSPNTAGAYLIMPDLRGYVIRGLDSPAAVDPDGASRYLGDVQGSAMWGHYHDTDYSMYTNTASFINSAPGRALGNVNPNVLVEVIKAKTIVTDGVNGTPAISSESRMTNVCFDYYIRY